MFLLPAIGLFSVLVSNAPQAQPGTRLHIRLTSAVSSYASKAGNPVCGVVIAPVISEDRVVLPQGSSICGVVERVWPVGLGIMRETAGLELQFSHVALPDGRSLPMTARVTEVDNAREHVGRDGRIRGVRMTASLSHRVSGYLQTALLWNVHARLAIWIVKSLIVQVPEPEIYYPAGVELVLSLTTPLRVEESDPEPAPPRLTQQDREELAALIAHKPYQTYSPASERPSDVVNVAVLGTERQISAAFVAAGWSRPDPSSFRASMKGVQAVGERRGDSRAPMSLLTLDGKPADLSWQKSLNDVSKRHHVRVWQEPDEWQGQQLWMGAATRDIDFAYLRHGQAMTHKIEENVDLEREKVAYDLEFTSCADPIEWLDRSGVPLAIRNATGDPISTDGRLAFVRLKDCGNPRAMENVAEAVPPRAHRNIMYRFLRREILSFRNEYLRTNVYWRSYEVGRWGVTALYAKRKQVLSARTLHAASRIALAPIPLTKIPALRMEMPLREDRCSDHRFGEGWQIRFDATCRPAGILPPYN